MIGECPSCLEGEVKPLKAERKLTAAFDQSARKDKPFWSFLILKIKNLSWEPVAPNLAHISFGRKNPKCQMEGLQSWTNWNTSKVLLWHLLIQIMKKQQICNTYFRFNEYFTWLLFDFYLMIFSAYFRSPQHHEDKLQPNKEDTDTQSKGTYYFISNH